MKESTIHDWRGLPDPAGPVTCVQCGCRLVEAQGLEGIAWRHFRTRPESDARGCRPRCLEDLHTAGGYVLAVGALDALRAAATEGGAAAG